MRYNERMSAPTVTNRNYLSLTDAQAAVPSATLQRIDYAEQAIDDYVGPQNKSVQQNFRGQVSSVSGKEVFDINNTSQLHVQDGYFIGSVIEIIGGTGKGQIRYISASSYANKSVTIVDDFTTPLDTTSFFKIYQIAQFPRDEDITPSNSGLVVYKSNPDAVRQAMIAQLEFINAQGDAFFTGMDSDLQSESIGNYSYSKGNAGQSSSVSMLAPRARNILRGLKRSGGQLIADNPTSL